MPDYKDVFHDYGVDKVLSPPQPVDERDIVSSTRVVWKAWYRITQHGSYQWLTFNHEQEGWNWLAERAQAARRNEV